MKRPPPPNLGKDAQVLVAIAARHCRMPHPSAVAAMARAVFPSIRASSTQPRLSVATIGETRLMHDDNMTPRWAFLWAHGIADTAHPNGWTFAHVWTAARDPDAYTNLANLVLMPEPLASMSDKQGPLMPYLQHHAQTVYGWKPRGVEDVAKPVGYDEITWAYMPPCDDPRKFVRDRLAVLNNERVKILRELMSEVDDRDA